MPLISSMVIKEAGPGLMTTLPGQNYHCIAPDPPRSALCLLRDHFLGT